ncbi:hypothetical protein BC828DRAFT_394279 [Blastocladiella britannica]|nr:hypothetical protein BC828DRAFT_394279 [Blastocladiella britannica]
MDMDQRHWFALPFIEFPTIALTLVKTGNREYYMSCTDIVITGGSGPEGTLSGPQLLVGNLPGSKYQFPEFPGTLPDNRAFFDERPTITVRGSRVAYNGAAPAKQATPAKQAPAGQVTASTPSVPASSSPSAKKKSAPAAFSASYCAAGQYSCSADKTAILQCNFGAWASHPVPAGTVCVTNGPGSAYIGRA